MRKSAFVVLLLCLSSALGAAPGLQDCPTSATVPGRSACPLNATCCVHEYYGANGCQFAENPTLCCAPGPALEPSTTLPNCLIIGDSVSMQYTPAVAKLLNATCKVQHAPWVGGGSANDAANGLNNLLNCRWLRTAQRPDLRISWDVIMFNFGLHDLPKVSSAFRARRLHLKRAPPICSPTTPHHARKADPARPEQLDLYASQLENITAILQGSGAAHLQFALTTPFQADALPDCGPYCSAGPTNTTMAAIAAASAAAGTMTTTTTTPAPTPYPQPANGGNGRCGPPMCAAGSLGCGVPNATAKARSPDPAAPGCGPPSHAVAKLNGRAATIMAAAGVPTLDLNALVHAHCGADYTNCTLCDDETK